MLIIALIAVVALTGADQLIKVWAIENLQGQVSREFIKFGDTQVLNLTYLENNGALFGSFSGMRWILIGVTSVLIIGCIVMMFKFKSRSKMLTWSLALVASGGLGNLIDRIFRGGSVVDYLEVKLFNFAIFNFADCCVVIGVIMMFIYVLFLDRESKEKTESEVTK